MKGKLLRLRVLWEWIGVEDLDRSFYYKKFFEVFGIKKSDRYELKGDRLLNRLFCWSNYFLIYL